MCRPSSTRLGTISDVYRRNGRLFSMGNGGSSCDAAHVAVEFLHPITAGRPALTAVDLSCDRTMITAVGNDVGFDHIFARQIIAQGRAGDGLIGISTSGNSANLVKAFLKAKEKGLKTIGLSGNTGGEMARMGLDHCLVVETDSIHRIQECHVAIYHILWDLVHTLLADDRGDLNGRQRRGGQCAMKYVDEFRDPGRAKILLREINKLVGRIDVCRSRPLSLMEVCGGHTHTIFKFGIETMLPDAIELVHGPGCPVCVLPIGRVDDCVALAETPGVIFTTFGDAMRVPGSKKSLLQAKAEGADVRMVYSPARRAQIRAPTSRQADRLLRPRIRNDDAVDGADGSSGRARGHSPIFRCSAITSPSSRPSRPFSTVLSFELDGFLGPGHVSMVIGTRPYRFIAEPLSPSRRDRWLRAARRAPIGLDASQADRRRPVRDRESV